MNLKSFLKTLLKAPLRFALSNRRLSEIVHWEMARANLRTVEVRIPLSHELFCPIPDPEAIYSFSEVFIRREYGSILGNMPLPLRWLDLGSHCGYFSLFMEWEARRAGLCGKRSALLVDGDPGGVEKTRRLLVANGLTEGFDVMHGAIAAGSGEVMFGRRAFMASSLVSADASPSDKIRVPILDSAFLMKLFPPPYDLIKVDIEGAEIEFFHHYIPVIAGANALLIEWHSWNSSGSDGEGIAKILDGMEFPVRRTVQPPLDVTHQGHPAQCGVELFLRC